MNVVGLCTSSHSLSGAASSVSVLWVMSCVVSNFPFSLDSAFVYFRARKGEPPRESRRSAVSSVPDLVCQPQWASVFLAPVPILDVPACHGSWKCEAKGRTSWDQQGLAHSTGMRG